MPIGFKGIKTVSHGGTSITEVQSISVPQEVTEGFTRGDNDIFPDFVFLNVADPFTVTVECNDFDAAVSVGDKGSLVFTRERQTSGADIVVTCANALLVSDSAADNHQELAVRTLVFKLQSSDGQTNPVSEA